MTEEGQVNVDLLAWAMGHLNSPQIKDSALCEFESEAWRHAERTVGVRGSLRPMWGVVLV